IFFDSKATTGKQGSDDDDFMGGLKQFFGYNADTNTSRHNKTSQKESTESSSGFYDEVDMALEHATDSMDGLWQQFKKGLFSLMGSFSAGDEDDDGLNASITPAPGLQQMKPIANPTLAVSETTLPPTGTPTTVRIITATTTPAIPTTTSGTASTVE
ncbi:hypothetical protein KR200_010550, partial [Drosophila serrata]